MILPPSPLVPISWGELLDKMTILEIKAQRITAPAALANVAQEYDALRAVGSDAVTITQVATLYDALKQVNERLWGIEDAIRAEEAAGSFGASFIALARAVYQENDQRAALKRAINVALDSALMEEKSYWSAGPSLSAAAG